MKYFVDINEKNGDILTTTGTGNAWDFENWWDANLTCKLLNAICAYEDSITADDPTSSNFGNFANPRVWAVTDGKEPDTGGWAMTHIYLVENNS